MEIIDIIRNMTEFLILISTSIMFSFNSEIGMTRENMMKTTL